jgi:hypothetical protein
MDINGSASVLSILDRDGGKEAGRELAEAREPELDME